MASRVLSYICLLMLPLSVLFICGCTGQSGEDPQPEAQNGQQQPSEQIKRGKQQQPAQPDRAEQWSQQVVKVEKALADGKLAEAEAALAKLDAIYPPAESPAEPSAQPAEPSAQTGENADPSKQTVETERPVPALSEEQLQVREALQARLIERRRELAAEQRGAQLAAAQQLAADGDYAEAMRAITRVLALSPTDQQYEQATALNTEIQRRLKVRRDLESLQQLLGSESRAEVNSARAQLMAEPDTAINLLLEWIELPDRPRLVANALNVLRRIKRPDVGLPAMVAVLKSEAHRDVWPDAVKEIQLTGAAGAGPALLALVLESADQQQRQLALEALSAITDPPRETLIALLPLALEDGPLLLPTLAAMLHAVRTHDQYDLAARRGIEAELSERQEQLLAEFPTRLEALAAREPEQQPEETKANPATLLSSRAFGPPETVPYTAQILLVATRCQVAEPLSDLQVFGFGAETDGSPAAAVLDGQWSSVEPGTMWRYPVSQRGSIVLDLGTSRTVTAVRIWNLNEPGQRERGWKDVQVFVSTQPRALMPTTRGVVPMAPGAAETPNYATTIPVDFAWGRYVKIEAESLWKSDNHTGLAEVEVLGF